MNIADDSSETYQKGTMQTARPHKSPEVSFLVRVEIFVILGQITGNRHMYQSWKVAFKVCIDSESAIGETEFIDKPTYETRNLGTQSCNWSYLLQINQCKAV